MRRQASGDSDKQKEDSMIAAKRRRRNGLLGVLTAAALTVATLVAGTPAQAGIVQFWDNLDSTRHPGWWIAGNGGFDYGNGQSHHGPGNAWVRNTTGWNADNVVVGVYPNADCVASAWIRLSDHVTGGYMSVRAWNGNAGPVIHEIMLVGPGAYNPANGNYNQYLFHFNPGNAHQVLFYVGMWGNGQDAWVQTDDVVIQCPTPN
jgi:hypothetical protein